MTVDQWDCRTLGSYRYVCEHDGTLRGVLTERDIFGRIVGEDVDLEQPVEAMITTKPQHLHLEETVREGLAAERLSFVVGAAEAAVGNGGGGPGQAAAAGALTRGPPGVPGAPRPGPYSSTQYLEYRTAS